MTSLPENNDSTQRRVWPHFLTQKNAQPAPPQCGPSPSQPRCSSSSTAVILELLQLWAPTEHSAHGFHPAAELSTSGMEQACFVPPALLSTRETPLTSMRRSENEISNGFSPKEKEIRYSCVWLYNKSWLKWIEAGFACWATCQCAEGNEVPSQPQLTPALLCAPQQETSSLCQQSP